MVNYMPLCRDDFHFACVLRLDVASTVLERLHDNQLGFLEHVFQAADATFCLGSAFTCHVQHVEQACQIWDCYIGHVALCHALMTPMLAGQGRNLMKMVLVETKYEGGARQIKRPSLEWGTHKANSRKLRTRTRLP